MHEHPIPRVLVLLFLLVITAAISIESIPQPRNPSHMYINQDGTYRYQGYTVMVKGDTIITAGDKSPVIIDHTRHTVTTECLHVSRDTHGNVEVWVDSTTGQI